MPLTLTVTEGVLPLSKVKDAARWQTRSKLDLHQLIENSVMTPYVSANVQILPKGHSFSGGKEFVGAWILNDQAMCNDEVGQAIANG